MLNNYDAAAAVAEASVVVVVDIEAARAACLPFCMGYTVSEEFDLAGMLVVVAPSAALGAPFEVLVVPERRLAHLTIHSYHDRWSQGSVWMGAAEILTWAERGMPLNEHCRTPLWPNSDRERTVPGLIFLDVRRVRCTKYRSERLRIAWKRSG
jgi:hypothetical protein